MRRLLALDGPEVAALLAGEPSRMPRDVDPDAILALTRDRDLLGVLDRPGRRMLQRDPAPPSGVHVSRWLADPVRELGGDPDTDPPTLCFTEDERAAAADLVDRLPPRFLALHAGAGSPAKSWPTERFATLVRRHARGRRWLLVAGPADEEAASALASLPKAVVAREIALRVLGAVLGYAGLFVGSDSGVSHLAAAAGAPTLALFGPTDATVWAPLGPSVETLSSPDGTVESLALETVSSAVGERLGPGLG